MLVCEGTTKTFFDPGRGPVEAIRRLDLRLDGGVVCLVGANGAGKSTLLRMIATLLVPDQGRILVDGIDTRVDPQAVRRRLGYLSTGTRCYARLSAREMLAYTGGFHGLIGADLQRRIAVAADRFGLGDFLDQRCAGLSTGQVQRVNLARVLLTEPALLVLDEPTTGLDIAAARTVVETIDAARLPGRLILYCTHIISEVAQLADRVLVLKRGTLIHDGPPAHLTRGGQDLTDAMYHMLDCGVATV